MRCTLHSQGKEIDLQALSEVHVRWPGHSVSRFDESVVIFLAEEQCQRHGVTVILRVCATCSWRLADSEFDPMSKRLLRVQLKSHNGLFLS